MAGNRLGQNIHRLRKEKGITQEELGSAVGVTAQAVSNWECGGMPDAGAAFYLQKKALAFSCERLSRQMSLFVEETERILEDLCGLDILYKLEVDTEDGEVTYFKAVDFYHCIAFLIPFLYAASELIEKAVCGFNNTSKTGNSLL